MPISYPENPVSIGDHIRKIRMELKLLQKDVAGIFGVSEDCIRNWKKNKSTPQIRFFPRVINFLGYMPIEVDLTTLSGKLKAYRHINGISEKQFGKVLGVDGATVCSWELEEDKLHKAVMKKIDSMLFTSEHFNTCLVDVIHHLLFSSRFQVIYGLVKILTAFFDLLLVPGLMIGIKRELR